VKTPVEAAAEIAGAVRTFSRHRYGAVLVWNPATNVDGGVVLDAALTRQLLVTIFAADPINRLRAGVTVISEGRVERAGVPLAWAGVAALAGDIAIAVDEETGEIRWASRDRRAEVVDAFALAAELHQYALGLRSG
jgi:DNA integrity scanning protein DisA with diadenylate cyclase activity